MGESVDRTAEAPTLLRGDITTVVAPFEIFQQSRDGTALDFAKLALSDNSRKIALGEYKASADAILHALDPKHPRRLEK
jgi:hypothetical protein